LALPDPPPYGDQHERLRPGLYDQPPELLDEGTALVLAGL